MKQVNPEYAAAQRDEQAALEGAMLQYLQGRTVTLNLEIRAKDARIAELEQRLGDSEKIKEESEVS